MKKTQPKDDDLRQEYEFRGGTRGKYANRYAEGSNVVVLDPDVAEMFTDSDAVNRSLRALGRIIKESSGVSSRGETP
jgi:sporulation-control protein spo0M